MHIKKILRQGDDLYDHLPEDKRAKYIHLMNLTLAREEKFIDAKDKLATFIKEEQYEIYLKEEKNSMNL